MTPGPGEPPVHGKQGKKRKIQNAFCFQCSSMAANLPEAEAGLYLYTCRKYFHPVSSSTPAWAVAPAGPSSPAMCSQCTGTHGQLSSARYCLKSLLLRGSSGRKVSATTTLKLFVSIVWRAWVFLQWYYTVLQWAMLVKGQDSEGVKVTIRRELFL